MSARNKRTLAVGLMLALTLGLMVAPLLGYGESPEEEGTDSSAILSKTARILGVEEEELNEALGQAFLETMNEEIDERVKEGWLGEEKAKVIKEELKERVEDGELFPWMTAGYGDHFRSFGRFGGPAGRRETKIGRGTMGHRGPGFGCYYERD